MIGNHTARPRDRPLYRPLDAEGVTSYLATLGTIEQRLGCPPAQWRAQECGDGNLNLVFVVEGPRGALVVKQALPYVRMVGESWPLSVRRNFFEHAALREQAQSAPEFVPSVYHADEAMALIVMEFLTPHTALRNGFMAARVYPNVGMHLGLFLARTLFNTSDLRLSSGDKKERIAVFLSNTAMCQISEDLIFDEPYFAAPMNRHTSPHLDPVAIALRQDADLKVAVQTMKWHFLNQPECLIHGDLHTGSIMVTESDTRVIDPEFAFYGPMGFDVGTLVANFLIAYVSQPGHSARAGDRDEYASYLLTQLTTVWATFASEFSRLWHERNSTSHGDLYNRRLSVDAPEFSEHALTSRLRQIWDDALGFAGCEVIRRIIGLAHVADFETIIDRDRRAACERRAIRLGRRLLMERSECRSIADLAELARECA